MVGMGFNTCYHNHSTTTFDYVGQYNHVETIYGAIRRPHVPQQLRNNVNKSFSYSHNHVYLRLKVITIYWYPYLYWNVPMTDTICLGPPRLVLTRIIRTKVLSAYPRVQIFNFHVSFNVAVHLRNFLLQNYIIRDSIFVIWYFSSNAVNIYVEYHFSSDN